MLQYILILIETRAYESRELLPSENNLILTYDCSRNTIQRAISALVTDGYVQTRLGKGMRNIFFTIGGIESFKESAGMMMTLFAL
ncbi:MAG: GntR family transcriptional regulator [Lachnospiraceae bacterium]|nr:GntR family transcriptional regulator [Lachnospiraceae bacterium]MDE7205421.1 GntR family transcriptional regulator [Lachnospiraceae bacterium]